MALIFSYPDYVHHQREKRIGHITMPKHSAFVTEKGRWDPDPIISRLSTGVVKLSEFGSGKKNGGSLLI